MDRERLVDEVLLLLPVLGRGLARPGREGLGEMPSGGYRSMHTYLRDTCKSL